MNKNAADDWGRRLAYRPALAFMISLLLAIAAASLIASSARARDAARFQHFADGAADRISAHLMTYVAMLRAGAAYIGASESVTASEFETFVARNRLQELYPGIQGFGYTARVPESERDSLISSQRSELFPDFRLWPDVAQDEEVHAIVFLFPLDLRNRNAIGFNMYSEATRREAMSRARDAGMTVMSGKVTLVQEIEGPEQAGFLIYSPVYTEGVLPPTVDERRQSLEGFVYAPFRADDLFQGIFGLNAEEYVAFRVYDGPTISPDHLLHDSRRLGLDPDPTPSFTTVQPIRVADQVWTVEFRSTALFEAEHRQSAWQLMLLLGTTGSIVLFLVMRREVAARADAVALAARVQETTRLLEQQFSEVKALNEEIEETNRNLESANRALLDSNRQLVALREEADAARDQSFRANQAKSEFLAAMSHELRTPLNAIMGYADLMQMGLHGPVTPQQDRSLDRIKRSQHYLLGLINDLLNFAKLEAGKVEVRREEVPVAELFADLRAMTEPQARKKGLTLELEPPIPALCLDADSDKTRQVLLNLLTNAIKFTPPGGRVRLSATYGDSCVRIRVSDTGPGIPADRLVSIFDPFVQVDRTSAPDGQHGVGLGLAISRDLTRLMDGFLTVESRVGEGSVFTLELPHAEGQRPVGTGHPSSAEVV